MSKFSVIVADPPWVVTRPSGWKTRKNHQSQPYPVVSVDRIKAVRVESISLPTSYLFLWTTNNHIEDAYSVSRAWGFSPVTMLTWCKTPRGMGPGGHFANTTEFCLYARRGGAGAFGRSRLHNSSWFNWPRRGQSEKPYELQDLIEDKFPGPYAELFARRHRLNWSSWGNEVVPSTPLKHLVC